MKQYIKTLIEEQGMEITHGALTILEVILEMYIEKITLKSLECGKYHGTIWKENHNNTIYDDDLRIILEFDSRKLQRETCNDFIEGCGLLC